MTEPGHKSAVKQMSKDQEEVIQTNEPSFSSIVYSTDNSKPARTPKRSPGKSNALAQYENASSDHSSITDTIIAKRKQMHRENQPGYSPSPTKSRMHVHNRLAQRQRAEKRNKRVDLVRGGLEKMEQFVINGEHLQELQTLSIQAQENAMTPDFAELLEQEAKEDLEDDELIQYFEQREHEDQELDRVLSELSLT